MKHLEHFAFLDDEHGAGRNRRSSSHADRLTCQAAFAKEIARCQNRDNRFFAYFINDGELYPAFLQVHYTLGGVALRVNDLSPLKLLYLSRHAGGVEESLRAEGALFTRSDFGFLVNGNCDSFHKIHH